MTSSFVRSSLLALAAVAATASFANAGTPYDGRWSLSITTTRGSCDTYNFPVDITNGHVSFPGLVKANGRVTGKGSVRVFVSAMGKSANGSGRLSASRGGGSWSGRSGDERCSGRWTAERA
ncbi:hypothetical protein [Rhodoplanes sp. Z2-YC6860]|uniref:hypothetical protein n=1 Tax=Rhodoplanes sp. Z2-YC6860 TaxID=674703 RepID=UPI00078D5EBC|nr:hypothetical protein [Rhodoplanes sp. Z2-YC6860]AMN42552.1 hypothetical protein RHPLAN_41210 [Rhodoplanes sp. Z2-YC6860]